MSPKPLVDTKTLLMGQCFSMGPHAPFAHTIFSMASCTV